MMLANKCGKAGLTERLVKGRVRDGELRRQSCHAFLVSSRSLNQVILALMITMITSLPVITLLSGREGEREQGCTRQGQPTLASHLTLALHHSRQASAPLATLFKLLLYTRPVRVTWNCVRTRILIAPSRGRQWDQRATAQTNQRPRDWLLSFPSLLSG